MIEYKLDRGDEIFISQRSLFESYGYRRYRMQRFEEFSLYSENKNFLPDGGIITFNDFSGRTLALRPDVTLSILKNSRAVKSDYQKYYYRENVYRRDKHLGDIDEIEQTGLECLGNIDNFVRAEVLEIAVKALNAIDSGFSINLSHMGVISAILGSAGINNPDKRKAVFNCIKSKNTHDLGALIDDETCLLKLSALLKINASTDKALNEAADISGANAYPAIEEMRVIRRGLDYLSLPGKINIDFSVQSDLDYYNGIIFQGYLPRVPHYVLSGGEYDLLAEKFKPGSGAIGFAILSGELPAYYPSEVVNANEMVIEYSDDDNIIDIFKKADELRSSGYQVTLKRKKDKSQC